jgi:hypothetical protein
MRIRHQVVDVKCQMLMMMMMMFIYARDRAEPIGSYRRSATPTLATSKLGSEPKNSNI